LNSHVNAYNPIPRSPTAHTNQVIIAKKKKKTQKKKKHRRKGKQIKI